MAANFTKRSLVIAAETKNIPSKIKIELYFRKLISLQVSMTGPR